MRPLTRVGLAAASAGAGNLVFLWVADARIAPGEDVTSISVAVMATIFAGLMAVTPRD
jgi:hypothetical protein